MDTMELDSLDTAILNRIQGDFPVSPDPYKDIAESLGIDAEEALDRVRRLKAQGVIRKVGPFFNPRGMGYFSTLCAIDVPEARVEEVASVISAFREVTHNYLREGSPNLWFTVIAPTLEAVTAITDEITSGTGLGPVINLPARKVFKIKVDLKVEK